jgi:hypothetical protein
VLKRGGTIAAAATAVVLGGSGLALGATTHDATLDGRDNSLGTPVQVTAAAPAGALAPRPRAQVAPAPVLARLPKPVTAAVTPVVKTVTMTVQALTKPTDSPPVAPGPDPVPPKSAGHPRQAATHQLVVHRAATEATVARTPSSEADAAVDTAPDAAFVQRTEPAVTPQLAPSGTGPLADLPGYARHALPTALVVAAAAILAALGAGHLGLWRTRRLARV